MAPYRAGARWKAGGPSPRPGLPSQLAALGPEVVATVRGLLDRDCVRSRLLWWDPEAEGCNWQLYQLGHGGFTRGLTLTFPDGAAGERRAWAMLAGLARGAGGRP